MKRLAGFSSLALIISATSGCGWLWGDEGYFRDRSTDYLDARPAPAMQIPPNVEAKRLDPLLPVPAHVADSRDSRQAFEVPRPQGVQVAGERASDSSLQKSGDSRWLASQRPPAEVWPVARAYFENNGFRITDERPQTGEFSSDWQSREELAPAMARRLGDWLKDSDGQLRVRVRIEPGVQRNSSEVFVASVERAQGSQSEPAFPSRSGNARLEAGLLDGLLADLDSSREHGSVSLLAARNYDAPSRVQLIEDGAGNPLLNLSSDFDRAWSGIGRALDAANIRIDDRNRSIGVYYINLAEGTKKPEEEKGFFSRLFSSKDSAEAIDARAERYQLRLNRAASGDVQVSLEKDLNTAAPKDVVQRVLSLLRDHLG